jgi:hypothetical protein
VEEWIEKQASTVSLSAEIRGISDGHGMSEACFGISTDFLNSKFSFKIYCQMALMTVKSENLRQEKTVKIKEITACHISTLSPRNKKLVSKISFFLA